VLKCICFKYNDTPVHLATIAARIEAVWVTKFVFKALPPEQETSATIRGHFLYNNLNEVHVAPGFPRKKDEEPEGIICRGLDVALENVLNAAPSANLADLLRLASAKTSISPPPGFSLLVRFVSALCALNDIKEVIPTANLMDLTDAEVVYLGPKSLLLRMPGADAVIKVAPNSAIDREIDIHEAVDPDGCDSLRSLGDQEIISGKVFGAGDGLSFLVLRHWCQPVPPVSALKAETLEMWWLQVGVELPGDGLVNLPCSFDLSLV
jgi:hypothetical protein